MEQDRYQENHVLFIVGLISLLLCLGLLFFTLFMLPHLLFGWRYDVPEFISYVREWISSGFGLSSRQASSVIFVFFSIWVFVFGLVAYYASSRIDNKIYSIGQFTKENTAKPSKKLSQGMKESLRFFLLVLGILIIAFAATFGFQWMISFY